MCIFIEQDWLDYLEWVMGTGMRPNVSRPTGTHTHGNNVMYTLYNYLIIIFAYSLTLLFT